MTTPTFAHDAVQHREATDGRRRELRALLLSAADAARQSRRVHQIASRVTAPIGRAVRDRIATLLNTTE